ncbi:MAG TPA: hypothetical protein VJ732_14385 [Bryobacteraceae bacterium]|nr:hypothetical protein [Bryobacteraceae bacterium]
MPKQIAAVLGEFGIEAHTAESRSWQGFTNGVLVQAAVQAGFLCILTRDRLFSQSAARALKQFPQFSVVWISLPQMRGPEFISAFRLAWLRSPIAPVPGSLLQWPS